jgi:hypothetical protein
LRGTRLHGGSTNGVQLNGLASTRGRDA